MFNYEINFLRNDGRSLVVPTEYNLLDFTRKNSKDPFICTRLENRFHTMEIDYQHQQILLQLTEQFPQLTEQIKPLLQTVNSSRERDRIFWTCVFL